MIFPAARHAHLRSRLVRRLGAGVAAAALALTGLTAAAGPVSESAAAAPSTECAPADLHRVRPGIPVKNDPNSISAAAVAKQSERLAARQRTLPNIIKSKIAKPTSLIDINVYVNVIRASGSATIDSRVNQQITVLNNAYLSSGFRFVRVGAINYVNNATWATWSENSDDVPAKTALHLGTASDLNLYVPSALNTGTGIDLLGYATFPGGNPTLDGAVIIASSLPGGTAPYGLGDTATHEVGHWLGLYHTFQGSCTFTNDMVKDTPAQLAGDNIYGCDESDDTCTLPGRDPVHNFMSYGDDACLNNFTPGQGFRMRTAWYAYRAPTA